MGEPPHGPRPTKSIHDSRVPRSNTDGYSTYHSCSSIPYSSNFGLNSRLPRNPTRLAPPRPPLRSPSRPPFAFWPSPRLDCGGLWSESLSSSSSSFLRARSSRIPTASQPAALNSPPNSCFSGLRLRPAQSRPPTPSDRQPAFSTLLNNPGRLVTVVDFRAWSKRRELAALSVSSSSTPAHTNLGRQDEAPSRQSRHRRSPFRLRLRLRLRLCTPDSFTKSILYQPDRQRQPLFASRLLVDGQLSVSTRCLRNYSGTRFLPFFGHCRARTLVSAPALLPPPADKTIDSAPHMSHEPRLGFRSAEQRSTI